MKNTAGSGTGARPRLADILVSLAGLVVFAFGLAAPLTPSEGCPAAAAVVLYAVGPFVFVGWGAFKSAGTGRILLAVQAILTAGTALWLLARIGCLG